MNKIVTLTAAAVLAMSTMGLSQAEDVLETPVQTSVSDVIDAQNSDSATELLDEPMAAANDADGDAAASTANDGTPKEESPNDALTAADVDPIPKDSPQVQKLIEWYPNVVARIKPYGRVCFEDGECDITLMSSGASANGGPLDGKAVYNQICKTCHASGLMGSPTFGDAAAWGPRIAKGKETLYDHAIHGFGAMPPKGGATIPDEEVQNAVDYMVENAS